jgi:hypothetical protein
MNAPHTPGPDGLPGPGDGDPAPSLDRDLESCPCGAVAEGGELCRKCRARVTWERRRIGRTSPTGGTRRPRGTHRSSSRRADGADYNDSTRPRGRKHRH